MPFVESSEVVFLKTIIPSRKATKVLDAFETGQLKRAQSADSLRHEHRAYTETMLKKDASIIHKCIEGRLQESLG